MEIDPQYTFVPLNPKNYVEINKTTTQELLSKWGLRDNIIIQNFSFNEPFYQYYKYQLTESFFKDDTVAKELLSKQNYKWVKRGIAASTVDIKQIPCSVLTMTFFNKLKNPENNIVYSSGTIRKRYDYEVDGFLISDNLRGMLLDVECPEYSLYSEDERGEFIFRIFQMLVLGGVLCQYEDTLDLYLEVTRNIYKDLIKVQQQKDSNDLLISTLVLQVVAKDFTNQAYFPSNPSCKQNVGFLLVDGNSREITTFLHQFGGHSS